MAWRSSRTILPWWLIRLPDTFDRYLASLPERTRTHFSRDVRKCEKKGAEFRILQRPEDVEVFLGEAEEISRLTYQWNLGYGTRNIEPGRERLTRLAKNGLLRCYLLYIQGTPCAFGWGELCHRTFVFQETGYDPKHRKVSPGTMLIMNMIRDLIENTNCEVFDFKWGGDDGYKARFGNISLNCVSVQAAKLSRPYALMIATLDQMVLLTKRCAGTILGQPAIKQRLRSTMRRYGIGTF